ncbi:hypothetical protein [Antrihabitans sp. YC2-6]|uniref:hypothetical protein n=1 Tax=Antrihabitans sp. YC2-6 TaxID=2799498 RepID=UPI0018F686EA|nr:hypothetical protein [Antrihabitans sp. YC2-6]MBJ8343972.1 hypothetical protein [Antrihabitans sp. YC2-6]
MSETATLFDINEVPERLRIKRNKDGTLRSSDLKAVQWYLIEHTLKPKAASAYPLIYFADRQGQEVCVNITEIVEEYRAFRKAAAKAARKKNAA